jgi:SAM-dependent methyltransferase
MTETDPPFLRWLAALQDRHLKDLTFAEVRRGLQALSSLYVERRGRIASGAALDGAGKRAAFALYLGPLHFLTVREVVRDLRAADPAPARIVDLGCGTGAAGAAWALEARPHASVLGVDKSGWAAAEARWTLQTLGLRGRAQAGDLDRTPLPSGRGDAIVAAFTANELDEPTRRRLLARLLEAAGSGARVLVVEPIAKRAAPWWRGWAAAFAAAGGRDDEWRFPAALPETVARLDRAAGLDHRELLARSLWIGPARP